MYFYVKFCTILNYSELFKEIRHKARITQAELGVKLGVGVGTIQKIEGGEREPSSTIKKLLPYVCGKYMDGIQEAEEITTLDGKAILKNSSSKEIESLKSKLAETEKENILLRKHTELQERTIKLLEDQIELYKDRLGITGTKSTG